MKITDYDWKGAPCDQRSGAFMYFLVGRYHVMVERIEVEVEVGPGSVQPRESRDYFPWGEGTCTTGKCEHFEIK